MSKGVANLDVKKTADGGYCIHIFIPSSSGPGAASYLNVLRDGRPVESSERRDGEAVSFTVYCDNVDLSIFTSHDLISRDAEKTKPEQYAEWLDKTLMDGPKPAEEVERLAGLAGMSWEGVRRASRDKGKFEKRQETSTRKWWWARLGEGSQ